jgi:hypothetical protein
MRWMIDVQLYFIDLTHSVLCSVNSYAAFRRSIMKVLLEKHSVDLKLTLMKNWEEGLHCTKEFYIGKKQNYFSLQY